MKKLTSIMALGLAFSMGAWADNVCSPMTGTMVDAENKEITPVVNCTTEQLAQGCEQLTYDSKACIDACVAGTIGDGDQYCMEARKMFKTNPVEALP